MFLPLVDPPHMPHSTSHNHCHRHPSSTRPIYVEHKHRLCPTFHLHRLYIQPHTLPPTSSMKLFNVLGRFRAPKEEETPSPKPCSNRPFMDSPPASVRSRVYTSIAAQGAMLHLFHDDLPWGECIHIEYMSDPAEPWGFPVGKEAPKARSSGRSTRSPCRIALFGYPVIAPRSGPSHSRSSAQPPLRSHSGLPIRGRTDRSAPPPYNAAAHANPIDPNFASRSRPAVRVRPHSAGGHAGPGEPSQQSRAAASVPGA